MKTKKQPQKQVHSSLHPNSHRNQVHPRQSCLPKRRLQANKQNQIQMTEPLDSQTQTYPSKEFILSREQSKTHSCHALKETQNHENRAPQSLFTDKHTNKADRNYYAQTTNYGEKNNYPRHHQPQTQYKQQEPFDRRLSLNCTGNYSQQLEHQKSQRLSMAPLRRDSASSYSIAPSYTAAPPSLIDQRQSLSSIYQQSQYSDSKSRPVSRKEAIITNLMHKLDHEQDLRSIIELKLKASTQLKDNPSKDTQYRDTPYSKDKRNQSYLTDFTEDHTMAAKLKNCENQIQYFKSVVKELSQKLVELTEEKRFSKKKTGESTTQPSEHSNEHILSLLKRINKPICGCKHKQSREIGVQAQPPQSFCSANPLNDSCDFIDNLQRTLKVLEGQRP